MRKCAVMCKNCACFYAQNRFLLCSKKGTLVLFLQFWITDTGVIDGLQLLDEHRLGVGNVAEGDGTLAEIAFGHLRVDQLVDQFADALLGIVGQ